LLTNQLVLFSLFS